MMGIFQSEYVIVETGDFVDVKKLDGFIEKIKDKRMCNLFHKFNNLVNGNIVYFMCWDGSKEGWTESNKADVLRKKFIDLATHLELTQVYHIIPAGDIQETNTIKELRKEGEN